MEDEDEKPQMQFKSREEASNYFRTVYAQMVKKTIEDKASKLIRKEQADQAEIAVIKAIRDRLPKVFHQSCPLHIARNLREHGFGSENHLRLYWAARNAPTRDVYDDAMQAIRKKLKKWGGHG